MTNSQKIKCVVLDWAGTAIDFGCQAPVMAFKYVLDDFVGNPIPEPTVRKYMGLGKRDHIEEIFKELQVQYDDATLDSLVDTFGAAVIKAASDFSGIIDGLLDFQQSMQQMDIILASNTGYTSEMMVPIRKLAAEQGYEPRLVLTSDQTVKGRPDPEGFGIISKELSIADTASMIKIGDNTVDMAEGINSGAWAIGVYASSNIIGKTAQGLAQCEAGEKNRLLQDAKSQLLAAGAHIAVATIKDAAQAVAFINAHYRQHGYSKDSLQHAFEESISQEGAA